MNKRNLGFWITIFKTEVWYSLISMKRYAFDTATGMITVYLMFLIIFYGLKYFAGSQFDGSSLDTIIVGYIMWMFAISAYSSTSSLILLESQQGTLEQLFMSPAGFHKLMFVRLVVGFGISILLNACLLFLTMLTSGRWLDIPYLQVLVLITLAVPAVYGLGYIFGGMALLFKRIESALHILQFGLIALVSIAAYPINSLSFLPFSAGAYTVNRVIVHGESFELWWYGFVGLNSVFYFLLGISIFRYFEKRAMKLNVLGHY